MGEGCPGCFDSGFHRQPDTSKHYGNQCQDTRNNSDQVMFENTHL